MNYKLITALVLIFGKTFAQKDCWSTELGLSCCELKTTKIEFTDNGNGHQYGIEDNHLCAINDIQLCPEGREYKCCKSCDIIYTDTSDWGVEDDDWCSIPYTC
jgi:hypothetical protein